MGTSRIKWLLTELLYHSAGPRDTREGARRWRWAWNDLSNPAWEKGGKRCRQRRGGKHGATPPHRRWRTQPQCTRETNPNRTMGRAAEDRDEQQTTRQQRNTTLCGATLEGIRQLWQHGARNHDVTQLPHDLEPHEATKTALEQLTQLDWSRTRQVHIYTDGSAATHPDKRQEATWSFVAITEQDNCYSLAHWDSGPVVTTQELDQWLGAQS